MSAAGENQTPDIESVQLSLTLRDSNAGGEKFLRQVGPGLRPLLLIEPDLDNMTEGNGVLAFKVDATDFGDTPSDLAKVLELIIDALRGTGDDS